MRGPPMIAGRTLVTAMPGLRSANSRAMPSHSTFSAAY
jgi:hypothetical protein